jgi:hypothetical protein
MEDEEVDESLRQKESRARWRGFMDDAFAEFEQLDITRRLFQPLREYAEATVDRLSWMIRLLIILQGVLVILMLSDILLRSRAILVHT